MPGGQRTAPRGSALGAKFGGYPVDLLLKPALAVAAVDGHVAHDVLNMPGGDVRVNGQAVMRERVDDRRDEDGVAAASSSDESCIDKSARLV